MEGFITTPIDDHLRIYAYNIVVTRRYSDDNVDDVDDNDEDHGGDNSDDVDDVDDVDEDHGGVALW